MLKELTTALILIFMAMFVASQEENQEIDYDCSLVDDPLVQCGSFGKCHSNGFCLCYPTHYGNKCQYKFDDTAGFGGMSIFIIILLWIFVPFCCCIFILQKCAGEPPKPKVKKPKPKKKVPVVKKRNLNLFKR